MGSKFQWNNNELATINVQESNSSIIIFNNDLDKCDGWAIGGIQGILGARETFDAAVETVLF